MEDVLATFGVAVAAPIRVLRIRPPAAEEVAVMRYRGSSTAGGLDSFQLPFAVATAVEAGPLKPGLGGSKKGSSAATTLLTVVRKAPPKHQASGDLLDRRKDPNAWIVLWCLW